MTGVSRRAISARGDDLEHSPNRRSEARPAASAGSSIFGSRFAGHPWSRRIRGQIGAPTILAASAVVIITVMGSTGDAMNPWFS
jgi:hypothetical protein